MAAATQATQLLSSWRNGDADALEKLTPMIYEELRRLADRYMRSEKAGHTLQPTALVHEAFIRLVDADLAYKNRMHFFAVAASMMRRLLVDHARARNSAKRGGGQSAVFFDEGMIAGEAPDDTLLELDDALSRLREFDERKSRIVELLFFGGLNYEEVATAMDLGRTTVYRELTVAKAWLHNELLSTGD